jgi:protein-tyrosine phosphatase
MLDYHCHILPGVDDGPATVDEAVEMAAGLQKAGFTGVYCTPHLIKGSFEADNSAILEALRNLQKRLHAENINLELIPGREYYMDEFLFDYLESPLPMGDTKYIMVEIPNHIPRKFVQESCFRIKRSGFIPMIAHPERNKYFFAHNEKKAIWAPFVNLLFGSDSLKSGEPSLLSYLRNIGCAFQANMGSFAGWYGDQAGKAAAALKEKGIYTHYGTDAHSPESIKALYHKS